MLVVKENKKFDTVFGDMNLPGVDADPSLVRWTADIVPNQRQLARDFNVSDRFFVESQESDGGHLFLTAAHMTEFTARFFVRGAGLARETPGRCAARCPIAATCSPTCSTTARPSASTARSSARPRRRPTAPSRSSSATVAIRAARSSTTGRRTATAPTTSSPRQTSHGLPDFTYMLLPDDHTEGSTPAGRRRKATSPTTTRAWAFSIDGLSHNDSAVADDRDLHPRGRSAEQRRPRLGGAIVLDRGIALGAPRLRQPPSDLVPVGVRDHLPHPRRAAAGTRGRHGGAAVGPVHGRSPTSRRGRGCRAPIRKRSTRRTPSARRCRRGWTSAVRIAIPGSDDCSTCTARGGSVA